MTRILIVDDEKSIRRTLGEFLREDGYEVLEAEDAEAALQRLRETECDVVVTDIILPRVTGVELLRRIRDVAPHVQTVMMTGEPTVETASEALRMGATDYLFKPITKEAIVRVVANAARIKFLDDTRRRLEAENRAHQENLEQLVQERTTQLQASEERYRSLVEAAFDWVWEVDPQGRYTYASPRVLELLGYRPDEVLGRTPFDFMPEVEAQRVKVLFSQAVARRGPLVALENINQHRDGRLIFLETSGTPILAPTGELLGYHGMDRDITERKRAEAIRETLHSLAARLSEARTPLDVAQAIFSMADRLWQWDAGVLDVLVPGGDLVEAVLCCDLVDGKRSEVPPTGVRGEPSPRIRRILAHGAELILRPQPAMTAANSEMFGDTTRPSASLMYVPIRWRGQAIGVLSIQSYTPSAFTEEDLQTLQGLADHCGGALERIQSEQEQALLTETIRSSRNEVYIFGADTLRFRFANDGALANLGYTLEQIRQLTPLDLKPEFTAESFARIADPLRSGEKVVQVFETVHRRSDGSLYPVDIHLQYFAHGGDPVFLAVIQDITERRQAEAALQAERTLLRTLVDHLPLAVYAKDASGRKTLVNPVDARNLGVASETDALGKTDFDHFPREQAERFRKDDLQVLESGQPILDREEVLTRPDGTTAWLLTSKVPLRDAAGCVTGLVGIGLEITKRRQAEEQLRKLARAVEQSPVSIVITNRAGDIEFVNPKFTQVTGYTLEEVLGVNPRILKSGETSAEEYTRLWETITAGKEWRGEFHNKRKDGSLFWETVSISPVRDATGAITHFIAVKEDVTEKKLTEAKFLRVQRVESIGSLASGIAHDLNNILTPIIMCAPLLQLEETAEGRRELAHTVEASANRAVGIVKQLLSFARGKEGQKSAVQARHLIRDMAKIARETFPRSIQVEEVCASDLWPVLADATQLHQILLNLCVNARDAMPSGGKLTLRADNVTLDEHFVSMYPEASPGPFVRIQVADTGTGIPDAVRHRIFESFFTTKDEGQGTGLGLATVQGLVKDHKGFVTFTTVPGKGTTFVIHLPGLPEAGALAETLQSREAIPRGRGELVLVVDDEPAICETTCRTLGRHGYAVLHAHDGIEALAQFSTHQPEVRAVVTDFMMPLMDGVTLCRTLRALTPHTPIIISSGGLFGKPGGDALRTFEELGIRHILQKPHTAEVLLRTLAEIFEQSRTPAPSKGTA